MSTIKEKVLNMLNTEITQKPKSKKSPIHKIVREAGQGMYSKLIYVLIMPVSIVMVLYLIIGTLLSIGDILFNTHFTVILNIGDNWLINIATLIFILTIIALVFFWIYNIVLRFTIIKIESIEKLLENTENQVEEISEILSKIQSSYSFVRIIGYMNYLYFLIWSKKYKNMLQDYLKEATYKIIFYLNNLRSDLAIRLQEQQSNLKSAKSEVEKNIKWTTELEKISELQKIRIDKQIEQFEELQRVLVKV